MCSTSKDLTVSLDYTKRNFFNPLAGARMRNPFFEKVRLKDFYLQFYFPFCNSKGKSARKAKPKRAPENTSDNFSPSSLYFNIKCKLRKDISQYRIHNSSVH